MKIINISLYILTLFLITCSENQKVESNNEISNVNSSNETTEIKQPADPPKKLDSLQYFLELISGYNKIPGEYFNKYLSISKPESDNFYLNGSSSNHHLIFDDFYLVFFSITRFGVCSYDHIATISKKGEVISKKSITEQCDHDQSRARYVSSDYIVLDSTTIKVTISSTEPKNKNFIDEQGFLPDTLTIEDIEMETKYFYTYYRIRPDGLIEQSDNL